MTSSPHIPLAELTHIALRLLIQEMGVVNTARFINQYTNGSGDYTKERDELFKGLTVDGIVQAIQEQKREDTE